MLHEAISRSEASRLGLTRYFTGVPCMRGHIDRRKTCDGRCVGCQSETDRAWRSANPEARRAIEQKSYHKHRAKRVAKALRWNAANRTKIRERLRENPEPGRLATKKWRLAHQIEINAYQRHRRHLNPEFRIRTNLANRINFAVRSDASVKSGKTLALIGCSAAQLRAHLESLFTPGMTWDNYGYGNDKWHVDHIRPCTAFDLTKPEQQRTCFHFTNLQPLWQPENFRKGNRHVAADQAGRCRRG